MPAEPQTQIIPIDILDTSGGQKEIGRNKSQDIKWPSEENKDKLNWD